MLTRQELRAAWDLCCTPGPRSARTQRVGDALRAALRAYDHELGLGERGLSEPRLDCLTTAVRALAGALRDRMAT